jgi:hypothetical protein
MSMIEDVLVPTYLFHRYQLEAVTKIIGGMNYSYAIRGDGQFVTRPLSKSEQIKALNAVAECLDPKFLALPERIIKLIPPRPAGFDYTKELFQRRTGLAFDPLAAAESAADLPLSLLFNPSRLNRMAEYGAENGGLGIDEMITFLIDKTYNAPRLKNLEGLIQHQNEQLLLTYLLGVSLNQQISFATSASIFKAIENIKTMASKLIKSANSEDKGYHLLTLERIKNRLEAKPFIPEALPPGAPIGCDMDQ